MTEFGILMDSKAEQPKKALASILFIELGMLIDFNAE